MSRSEIEAWNTGRDVALYDQGPALSPEQIAYTSGIAYANVSAGIARFLQLPRADLALMLTPDALAALDALGHDRWAHWVRQGFWDARR